VKEAKSEGEREVGDQRWDEESEGREDTDSYVKDYHNLRVVTSKRRDVVESGSNDDQESDAAARRSLR